MMIHQMMQRLFQKRAAFTLVELLVTFALLSVVGSVVWQVFSSGIRGSRFAQETIDHIRDSAILFRAIDRDIQRMIPWPVFDSKNNAIGGEIVYSPSNQEAHEMRFWIRNGSDFQQIRYRFSSDATEKKLFREELNKAGNVVKSENYGGTMIENFIIRDPAGEGMRLKITVVLCSKLKKNSLFERVFSIGVFSPAEARHWVYD